ncbi:MAG: hypothetical protein JXA13_05130 [Anaerolineales bacterium]|nr:hypothetical protein [Anaerolineales bacterium]
MVKKNYLSAVILFGMVSGLLSCNLPTSVQGLPTGTPNIVGTTVAGTLTAAAPLPTATGLPSVPTATLVPARQPSATPSVPQVWVSVDTNCRVGPGKIYDRVGGLMVGETAEVVARNSSNTYWYIRNPDAPGSFCWLWGNYAAVSGDVNILPVYTALPTSTPPAGFVLSYHDLDSCSGWFVVFNVENTGDLKFKSYSTAVYDKDTNTTVASSSDSFDKWTGCIVAKANSALTAGEIATANSGLFSYDPSGHKLSGTITLCTEEAQSGLCLSRTIDFTP